MKNSIEQLDLIHEGITTIDNDPQCNSSSVMLDGTTPQEQLDLIHEGITTKNAQVIDNTVKLKLLDLIHEGITALSCLRRGR